MTIQTVFSWAQLVKLCVHVLIWPTKHFTTISPSYHQTNSLSILRSYNPTSLGFVCSSYNSFWFSFDTNRARTGAWALWSLHRASAKDFLSWCQWNQQMIYLHLLSCTHFTILLFHPLSTIWLSYHPTLLQSDSPSNHQIACLDIKLYLTIQSY